MARLKQRADEVGLREYLLEEAVRFRELCGSFHPDAWTELSKAVNQLVGGESYRFHRYELPCDHPLQRAGGMTDALILTGDDVLVSYNDVGGAIMTGLECHK